MKKINLFIIIFFTTILISNAYSNESFEEWKINFKKYAFDQGISQATLDKIISNTKFLPDVIKYDRYQPEFYEDIKHIFKRT